jgi:excisionase family DNA binding protein
MIESVLRLARAERSSRGEALNDIRVVREHIESSLGGAVRAAEAARLLGVSRPSLKRWLDSGDIPTVLTREGRREIPISELLDLLLETEELRRAGRERVLGAVIRGRRERAAELDVDALLPSRRPRTHRQAELQSLAYHRLVADRLTPPLVAEALRTLDRWESEGQLDPRWASEWQRVLERPLPEIQRALRSDSKLGRELRQTSPFVGLVTEQERRRIIEAVEARR